MRIIWAIDAFEDNKDLNRKMAETLISLRGTTEADIEPLYLLRENEILLPTYEVPSWVSDHSKTAEALFKEVLADYHLDFLLPPKVIPHASASHAGAAETLCAYAKKTNADMIVVGSHGREGFQRFLLGSFAESLLMDSCVPVLVIGAHSTKTSRPKNIFFPTEFGDHSKENFKHVLNLAKLLRAEITLFHAISRPIESLFDLDTRPRLYSYEGSMQSLDQIIDLQIKSRIHKADNWVSWAANEGVVAHSIVDSSFKGIDELILQASEQNAGDLIVMEAQSGPMSAALLGSYTRTVVRKAKCPVYVIPHRFYETSSTQKKEQQPTAPF
jgi:nucleotide-binding universal stress UspA family protein